jgi:hypothetical protein
MMIGSRDYHIDAFVESTEQIMTHAKRKGRCFALVDGAKILWDNDNDTVLIAAGNVHAKIVSSGKSNLYVICKDQAKVDMTANGSCAPTIVLRNYADLKLLTSGTSEPKTEAHDQSRILIIARENSRPFLNASGSSTHKIVVQDMSMPNCVDWPENWIPSLYDIYIGQRLSLFDEREEATNAAGFFYCEWSRCHNRFIACQRAVGAIPKVCPNVVHFRCKIETMHLELPCTENPKCWYTFFVNDHRIFAEEKRLSSERHFLD